MGIDLRGWLFLSLSRRVSRLSSYQIVERVKEGTAKAFNKAKEVRVSVVVPRACACACARS